MSGEEKEELTLKSFEELSFFDNLALYYLCNETPPQTLALAFLIGDKKSLRLYVRSYGTETKSLRS